MLRHFSIRLIGFHVFTAALRASCTTLGAKRPTGPCCYQTAPVHHQRQLPSTFYIDFRSRFADKPILSSPLLTGPGATVSVHRSNPLCTDHYSRRADRPTPSLPILTGPGVTASAHRFDSSILTTIASALTGLPFPHCYYTAPAPSSAPTISDSLRCPLQTPR